VRRKLRQLSPGKAIITAGAVAAALGSIIALGTAVGGWFKSGPEGSVKSLRLQPLQTLTYEEWRQHEEVPVKGVPQPQRQILGKMISYDIETTGYRKNTELPVRVILHDKGHHRTKVFHADPVKVARGEDCGCFDWVAIPPGPGSYYIEVAIFRPGRVIGQQPLRSAMTSDFEAPEP
jgi:hypothetical protein